MKLIIPTLLIFSLIACSKGDEPIDAFSECTEVTDDYKRYNGESIDCEYHYVLTEYNGQQYIELRAHCDDLIRSYVINEDCVDICGTSPYALESECGQYLQGRVVIETILIEK